MTSERRQFRILYRDFLGRVIDPDLLSRDADQGNLLGQLAAMLMAFSFVLSVYMVQQFRLSGLHRGALLIAAWQDEEFFFANTMAVAGMLSVVAWNNVLPDRRESLILAPLPVRARTIFFAKAASIGTALGTGIVAVNLFTGLLFPFLVIPENAGFLGPMRAFLAYWISAGGAGLFVFCALLGLQGLAGMVLSYRLAQKASGFLQLLAFFIILSLYFLTPPLGTPGRLANPVNQGLLAWLPSFWFLGLFHQVIGNPHPALRPLATHAAVNLLTAVAVAGLTWTLTYRRNLQRVIEQPDIAPGDRTRPAARVGAALVKRLLPKPLDRAIVLFAARSLARSRQHRLLLAVYGGIALAISLAYTKELVYGTSREHLREANIPVLVATFVPLLFALIGTRAVFALPLALRANWIFRLTAVHRPASYFAAVRKSLLIVAALPVCAIAAVVCLGMWPGRPAAEHLIAMILVAFLMTFTLLGSFRKIPFACSYLPGKTNLKIKVGAFGILFLLAVEAGAHLELWSLQKTARFGVLAGVLLSVTFWARRRTLEFSDSPYNRVQFEDVPVKDIQALDLRADGAAFSDDAYADAFEAAPRSLGSRLRRIAFTLLVVLGVGIAYESAAEWRDRRRYPQTGRSVDVGGRTLNIYCSGTGSPAVVMDAGGNQAGYSWALVQPRVAEFTKACWYDRAGYGWSDAAPDSRTSRDIARDLHKLLKGAGMSGPWVLVGHSFGGFNVRVFAKEFPREVAGMVLVESADEDEGSGPVPAAIQAPGHAVPVAIRASVSKLLEVLVHAGVGRLFDDGPPARRGRFAAADIERLHAEQLRAAAFDASLKEGLDRSATLAQVREVKSLGDMPLVVLTAGWPGAGIRDREMAAYLQTRIHVRQAKLAGLSTRGRQLVIDHSGHDMPADAPEAIVSAVREVVDRGAGQP